MNSDYEKRLDKIDEEDVTPENTSKSIIATGEDTTKVLKEMQTVNKHLESISGERSNKTGKKKILNTASIQGARFIVNEYDTSYIGDLSMATDLYHAQKLGMKLRNLEVDLLNGSVTMESGMFQSSEGSIQIKQSLSPFEMIRGAVRKMNKETFFRPEFGGTGKVHLESNFKFIQLLKVENPTRIVLEKGIYLASAGDWKYKTAKNFNLGMMMFSEKSLLQTELSGVGIIALELPIHPDELVRHVVTQDRPFKVSGDYVLYWTGRLKRSVNPAKKLLGNMASGAGIVEEYTGEGYVYTAPTLGIYNQIARDMSGKNTGNSDTLGNEAQMGKQRHSIWDKFGFRGSNKYNE